MKRILILLLSCITAITVLAQNISTVTINVRGNANRSIAIDGNEYPITNDNNTTPNTPIVVSNLPSGQHTLQIHRNDEANPSSTTFTTRVGYDLQITITANGSVQLRETKWRDDNMTSMTAMSSSEFNNLYTRVRRQWGSSGKMTILSEAFANTNNYFTTAQAKQLIALLNSQANRLTLAKASYRGITDPVNFSQMADLFNSSSHRDQLTDYVSTYNEGNSSTAMTAAKYNNLYRTAQRQSTLNSKISYIYNAFTNSNNYFTVAQSRQLILLVPDEPNRLYLAKVSYRSIIDKYNFSQISDLLRSQASRNELGSFIRTYNVSDPVYTKVAMKDADYNVLYRDIQNRFGIGAKMSALTNVFANENYYFTVVQARQLIQLVSSESNRLELSKASYNNVVDPVNFNQLHEILANSSSRNELEQYVRDYENSPATTTPTYVREPVSASRFNDLYNEVRNTWGLGAKMAALTEIFENESYYFTVAQAKQLVQLVSAESNRLQLAKSAYGNITDPENFKLMYEVLSSQASKNELSAYVNTYSYNR